MRVLIVGTGYIGLPLSAELVRHGHEVFGLRRNRATLGDLEVIGVKPLFADITEPGALTVLPRNFDWVVNCVASGGGGTEDYKRVYLEGMRHLIEWLAPESSNRSGPKIVYTGSTSVYGQTDGSVVDENSLTEPAAGTAQVLAQTEKTLLDSGRERNFSSVILRVAGIYGPGRGYWLRQFLNGEARLEGRGDRFLNMIHRDDVLGCIIAALERGRSGEIYNAVDDYPVTQSELFRWLANALGKPLPPALPEDSGSPGKRGFTNKRISNEKLRRELGYRFKFSTFRDGYNDEIRKIRNVT